VKFGLSLHPHYPALLARLLKQDPPTKFLDLGTCLGQDLRKLVHDGVSPSVLYGSDYFSESEAAGNQLFRDADTFQHRFIAADLFDETEDSALQKTKGEWDVINITMFLHMYDWPTQLHACKRILTLSKREKGSMVIGAQTGSIQAGEMHLKSPIVPEGQESTLFRHNLETLRQMWETVGLEEGLRLKVEVQYDEPQDREATIREEQEEGKKKFFSGPEQRRLFFTVMIE